ncbi:MULTISPECIES: DUF3006 domain-containing protein [Deinococcus]|nr:MULTISPECIES: DUF3006 domain-containing protein [Deinococcus]
MMPEDLRPETERSGGQVDPAPQRPGAPAPDRWTVDALEETPHGPVARLERPDGATVDVPARHLPAGVREGDLLAVQDGPDGVRFQALPDETRARRTQAQAQLDALNARQGPPTNDQGEIDL